MTCIRVLSRCCVGLACLGLLVPGGVVYGQPATGAPTATADRHETGGQPPEPLIGDVKLDADGVLRGVVVDLHGVPLSRVDVIVRLRDRDVARVSTDGLGAFSAAGLRGGLYQLSAAHQTRLFRVWAARTAPPHAAEMALVVVGGRVVRGQLPLQEFFESDGFIITAMIATMIAVPLAVRHSEKNPHSP